MGDAGHGFWVFGVGAAGEHEILPNHNSVAVCKLIEGVCFVDAATPDADHVGVAFHEVAEGCFVAFLAKAGQQGVARNPVVATSVDWHVVDDDLEGAACIVNRGVDCHGAQADVVLTVCMLCVNA